MSRVLVTGASGFLGRHVVGALIAAGHDVHAVTTREREPGEGVTWHTADLLADAAVVAEVEPEVLVHLAWSVEPGLFWNDPENVRWVEASLALLRAFGGGRAVIAGTCAEYDWAATGERCHETSTPLRPATLYGAAKHALQSVAARYAEQAGFELAWGRIFFMYGPGEPESRLVPSVARALLAGEPVPTTRGLQVRDFMHVADAGAAFAALTDAGVTGPVNIGTGRPVTVRAVVEALAGAAGRPDLPRPGELRDRKGDPARLVADVSRLRDEVGFEPRMELEAGLRDTLDALRTEA